jgi:hypothetical protein
MAFISACKSWMFKERKNLYFLICCQGILVAFEFAMDFKVDTPKAYAAAHRANRVRSELDPSSTITAAIYGAGYTSNGRFYAASPKYWA